MIISASRFEQTGAPTLIAARTHDFPVGHFRVK